MNTLTFSQFNDESLVEKIVAENQTQIYGVLYNRYFPKVLDKCYSFVKNKKVAEELANDILSKAFEKLGSFKGKSSFSSWLYSISYNYIIDFLRKKKQLHYPKWNKENELPEIIDETDTDINELSYEKLLEVLEMIHPEEKALLLMKYMHAISIKDIAVSLSISEDAVKMRLKRARSRVIYTYFKQFGND
jgi:RNA polymerase sigma factor (sigma-70 family)